MENRHLITKWIFVVVMLIITVAEAGIVFAQDSSKEKRGPSQKGLKDYYKDFFIMGVAVSPRALEGAEAGFIKKHFASITAENAMKMGPIHPEENRYYWDDADRIVAFAQTHGLKLRGHVLCWHEQTPSWLFKDDAGNTVSKEVLLQRLKEHITTVVTRYKGKVYAWDVVNEVISDDSTEYLRNSTWFKICGDEFISKAFEYAHAADPEALLFYNDYNAVRPEKRDRVYRLMHDLKSKGVPVHGLGIQGHWSIFEPSETELRAALEKYASLDVNIQITELDVSIYRWEKFPRKRNAGEADDFTAALEQQQIEQYRKIFNVFRDYKNVITGVTFWNISDKHSWLDNYPVKGRKNYPLLFDRHLQPKRAYWEVVKFDPAGD